MTTRKSTPVDDDVEAFEKGDFDLTKMRPAEVRVAKQPKNALAVRFDPSDLERLRQRAEAEGVGITQLVRTWVLERLNERKLPAPVVDLMAALEASLEAARVIQRESTKSSQPPRRGRETG